MDLMYIQKYSLALDIKLIIMTVKILFKKDSTEGFKEKKFRHPEVIAIKILGAFCTYRHLYLKMRSLMTAFCYLI